MSGAPERGEAADYYFKYIDQVPPGDVRDRMDAQGAEAHGMLNGITEKESLYRYAPGKWSIRDVVNHLSDTERLFAFRAFWFARGFDSPLPSFDEGPAAVAADADRRSWKSLIEEFAAVRASTSALFRSLPEADWARRGIASGNPFSVRALAYIAVGHANHHFVHLQERYLPAARTP
jgi:hypothetical protein